MMALRRDNSARPEQFVWLALVSVAGCWTVMIPSKIWEGVDIEPAARRFTLLVGGLLLGALAYGLAQFLSVNLTYDPHGNYAMSVLKHLPDKTYSPDAQPMLLAFLAYFGFLLLVVRWWRQAEPERHTRLSLTSAFLCVLAAWVLQLFWPFPQPWGLMIAGVMAVSIQLASPCQNTRRRWHKR
jgi:hypothetical protein